MTRVDASRAGSTADRDAACELLEVGRIVAEARSLLSLSDADIAAREDPDGRLCFGGKRRGTTGSKLFGASAGAAVLLEILERGVSSHASRKRLGALERRDAVAVGSMYRSREEGARGVGRGLPDLMWSRCFRYEFINASGSSSRFDSLSRYLGES